MKSLLIFLSLFLSFYGIIFPQIRWQKQVVYVPSNAIVGPFSHINDKMFWASWSTCWLDSTQFKNGFLKESRNDTPQGTWIIFSGAEISETEFGIVKWIEALDSNIAFVVTENWLKKGIQGIYKTTDGGVTWQKHPLAYSGSEYGPGYIHFFDNNNGVVVGEKDTGTAGFQIYTTTNSGTDWNEVPQGNIPPLYDGEKMETTPCGEYGDCIWLSSSPPPGHGPRIFKTTDKGYQWMVMEPSGLTDNQTLSLAFQNETTGLMVISSSLGSMVKKTTDGGETWSLTTRSYGCRPNFICNLPGGSYYVITGDSNYSKNSGGSAFSTDGGVKWTSIDNGNYSYPYFSSSIGYCSQWGTNNIYGLLGNLKTSVSVKSKYGDINLFSLGQNYPNPFNPTTSIEFQIKEPCFVSLKIYNTLGNEVATVVNKQMYSGYYKYQWNGKGTASGVYFYKLKAGNYTAVKKMLLIK